MRVLLTGAFGNVGESTLVALLEHGFDVRCLDLLIKTNRKRQKTLIHQGKFETIWGDLRDPSLVRTAVDGIDCIIHTAAIIPPTSDKDPEFARQVNVDGTRNLIEAAESLDPMPKFIFTSSVAVYGHPMKLPPPRTATDPVIPTDPYTDHKIQCETMLKKSELPWTILRLSAVTPLRQSTDIDSMMYEVPLDQRIEFVHTRDVGVALANAVTADTVGKVLLIGGGKSCQMFQRKFVGTMLDAMGIGMLPETAFRVARNEDEYFHTDWLDTEESQRLLQYQSRSFDLFVEDYRKMSGLRRHLIRLLRPYVRRKLLAKSPYFRKV